MKLFGRQKSTLSQEDFPRKESRCTHPVSHQVALQENPADPRMVTGFKCSQCGQVLSLPPVK